MKLLDEFIIDNHMLSIDNLRIPRPSNRLSEHMPEH